MNLKESFDNCMSGLGCLAVVATFFALCGYVCYMSLFENTIGILGWVIGGVLLVVMAVSTWIILCSIWYFIRDAWKEKRKTGENGDSTPDEAAGATVREEAGRIDPYEAAVLPQTQTEVRDDGDAPEVHEVSRAKANLTLIKNAFWLVAFACTVLLQYQCTRDEKQRDDETEAAVLCMDGMTAYRAKDYDAAVELFTKAAGNGSAKAKYMLGVCCYDGTGTDKDWDAAFRWFYEAGKQDYTHALYRLGLCCEQAVGTERDMEKALFCWVKAAKLDHAESQYRAGSTAITVFGEFDDGVAWLRRSAEQGNPFAMRFLGFVFAGKDKAESDKWYRKAAEALYLAAKQGDPHAQHDLAGLYRDGLGVAKDPVEADKWFVLATKNYRAAAEQGDPEAQCMLGGFYMKGVGVDKDEEEGVKWFRKAAEQGFMKGKALLGLAYFEGRGVKQDEAEGVRWLRAAAEQGDPESRAFLDARGK